VKDRTPFYKDDDEKAELIAMRDAFTWDAPAPENRTIMLAGMPGEGKTHLLCSLAAEPKKYGPVYLFDTEYRAHIVANKFNAEFKEKRIHVALIRNYSELVAGIKSLAKMVKEKKLALPFVVGIDSGTDVEKFAELKYCIDNDKETVGMPIQWPKMYAYCYAVIDELKYLGATVVYTTKVKDVFLKDQRTGKVTPRVFKDMPYRADIMIEFDNETHLPVITKTGFQQTQRIELTERLMLPRIIEIAQEVQAVVPVALPLKSKVA
jgi:hypothetical protein